MKQEQTRYAWEGPVPPCLYLDWDEMEEEEIREKLEDSPTKALGCTARASGGVECPFWLKLRNPWFGRGPAPIDYNLNGKICEFRE